MDTRTLVKLAAVSAYAAAGGALVVAAIVASSAGIAGAAAFIPIGAAAFPMALTGYVTLKMMD